MTNRILLLALLLPACSEYSVSLGTPDPAAPPPDEICNGVDDDGDGQIDEDQPDVDGDGVADCVDIECAVELAMPRSGLDPACEGDDTPPVSPWELTTLWQLPGIVYTTPMVGDLDGDGVAEVVLRYSDTKLGDYPLRPVLAVLDGATGEIEWTIATTLDLSSSAALADLDEDGDGDIVIADGTCWDGLPAMVSAYDGPTGDLLWGPVEIANACNTHPAVGDIDADGTPEVVVNEYVLDGATGAVELILPVDGGWYNFGAPVIVDMDLDGQQEIILEGVVFSNTGEVRWMCGPGGYGTFPAPVNVDADPEGELLVVSSDARMATLCDDDGTMLWNRVSTQISGGAPAVADLTGDGLQEVVIHENGSGLVALNGAGEVQWSVPVSEGTFKGAITWDVDLDGVPEVLYFGVDEIVVVDGQTGEIRWSTRDHESGSPGLQPVVADVNGDGTADLLTAMSTYFGSAKGLEGLRVRTSLAGDWPDARPTWNQLNYWGGNIADDLSVPQYQEPPWRTKENMFRGQPGLAPKPNLRGEMTDLCVSSCESGGLVHVAAQVWNDGAVDVPETVVELLGADGEVLASATVGPVPAGGSVEIILETTYEAASGGLELVVDGSGTHTFECREDDNRATIDPPSCP